MAGQQGTGQWLCSLSRMPNGQHRAVSITHHPLGGASEENVLEPGITVGAEDDEVGAQCAGCIRNLRVSAPHPDQGLHGSPTTHAFRSDFLQPAAGGLDLFQHRFLALPVIDAERHMVGVVDMELYTEELGNLSDVRNLDELFARIARRKAEFDEVATLLRFIEKTRELGL